MCTKHVRDNLTVLLMFSFLFGIPTHAQKVGSPLEGAYKKWLDEDVRWIIGDQERADFKKLSDDKERRPVRCGGSGSVAIQLPGDQET
jgi:hypothetical protein